MVGRTKGPCSDTFQPKIFRLKIDEIPKVHGWKDQRSVFGHFSAKNISFENGIFRIFRSFYKFPKVHGWKDQRSVFGHFSAKNISFEIRKK